MQKHQFSRFRGQKGLFVSSFLLVCCCLFSALLPVKSLQFLHAQTETDIRLRPYTQLDPLDSLQDKHWLRPATSFNANRFWTATGVGTGLYLGTTYALWQTWYADFPRSNFQTIDDWPEWLQMDKAGHTFTAYQYARYAFAGARWTGMKRPSSRITAFGVASLLQGTIEVLDGYSTQWGFSWSDIGANTLGASLFIGQDLLWQEQRILLKVSNNLRPIPDLEIMNNNGQVSNLGYIVRERFGSNLAERYLKDYNNQTIWMSWNPRAFAPRSNLPHWLNIAVGYGVENVYGALGNNWSVGGEQFLYPEPRYRQLFLSPDIYFSRIPTKRRWVRLILGALDFFKMPAPALEFSNGGIKGHLLMW